MGLLPVADVREIARRSIGAGLAPKRDLLFFGMAPQIVTAVRADGAGRADDALRTELDRLNNYQERTADGFLLAVWLRNCVDNLVGYPAEADYFLQCAVRVEALSGAPPPPVSNLAGIMAGARAEASSDDQIQLAVSQMEGTIGALGRRATALMVSKRLHDVLHRIQLNVLPLWRRSMEELSNAPTLWQPIVKDRQRALRTEAASIAGEYSMLPPDDALAVLGAKTSSALMKAVNAADAALDSDDSRGLQSAFFNARDVVKDDMRTYATRIEANLEALDLGVLVENLTRLAEHAGDDDLIATARSAASALAAIAQDLKVFGPQHRLWQNLDVQLWLLEEQFSFLSMGRAAAMSFDNQWAKVAGLVDELAGMPPADWFEKIGLSRQAVLKACPVPVDTLPDAAAAGCFDDFVLALRSVFQTVDQRMKDICNLLREITVQLARI